MRASLTPPLLIEVTRGPRVESSHRGHIAVVDAAGNLVHGLGDAEAWVCMRSLAKPFQALAVLTSGAAAAFGFRAPRSWPCFPGRCPARTSRWNWPPKFWTELGLTPEALQCGVHPPCTAPRPRPW